MTDTSNTSTEARTSAPVMEQIDPTTLLIDTNVRAYATPDKTLIESVRDLGVLVPVVAVRTEDGVRVRYGHRAPAQPSRPPRPRSRCGCSTPTAPGPTWTASCGSGPRTSTARA